MNLESVFNNFAHLADAPNSVIKLREMFLQLAVEGKLVAQQINTEPALVLLQRIQKDKDEFIRRRNGVKAPAQVDLDCGLFTVPENWKWVRLDEITNDIHYGYTAAATHAPTDVRLLRITDIQNGKVDWSIVPGCAIDYVKLDGFKLANNDILIARTGGTIGKSYLVQNLELTAVFASYLIRVIPNKHINAQYLKVFLESPFYWTQLYDRSMGTGQPNVNATSLNTLVLPLPPLEEQERIVTKVHELMRLCNDLEAKQHAKRESVARLNNNTLASLNDAASFGSQEIEGAAARLAEHFDKLYDSVETVGKLRSTILQLAVRRKLVHKDEDKAETDSRVSDYVRILNGYAFKSEWFVSSGIRLLRNTNVGHGTIQWDEVASIATARANEFAKFALRQGDIVISLDRPLISTGLKVARISQKDVPSLLLQRVGKVELKNGELCSDYFFIWLHSPAFVNFINPGRSNGVPHISSKSIEAIPFSPPPLKEQKRIVAKVNQLMALCHELEAELRQAETHSKKLINAAVRHVLQTVS